MAEENRRNSGSLVNVAGNVRFVDFRTRAVMSGHHLMPRVEDGALTDFRLLANVTKVSTLVDLLGRYQKTHDGAYRIRACSEDLPKLVQCAAKAAIEGFTMGDMHVAANAANLLSINSDVGLPNEALMRKFRQLLDKQMSGGSMVGAYVGQSLASIDARAGDQEVARRCLGYLLGEPGLRQNEWRNLRAYYGSEEGLYRACDRHDRDYVGRVFQVWLLPSLMVDLEVVSLERLRQATVPTIRAKLVALERIDAKLARELEMEMSGILRRRLA